MTLQSSGAISIAQVNTELGRSSSATLDMNSRIVRQLGDRVSGGGNMTPSYGASFPMSALYGKSRRRSHFIGAGDYGNRNYAGADPYVYWGATGGTQFLTNGTKIYWNAGAYDSQSLDLQFSFENKYMWGDWSFVYATWSFYIGSWSGYLNSASFYCTPFYGNYLGNIIAYGSQLGPNTIYGNGWVTFATAGWGWGMPEWVRPWNQISLICQINHNGTQMKAGEYFFTIDPGTVTLEADIN